MQHVHLSAHSFLKEFLFKVCENLTVDTGPRQPERVNT